MSETTAQPTPVRSADGDRSATAAEPLWTHHDDLAGFSPAPGVTVRVVPGQLLMISWIRIEPHRQVPIHHHPNEQIGTVLAGSLELTIGTEVRQLGVGAAFVIPPDVPHGATTGPDGCLVLETFAPPRADYLALAAGSGR